MKRLLHVLLLLLPVFTYAQADIYISTAEIGGKMFSAMDSNWRMLNTYDTSFEAPDYNDSSWVIVNTRLEDSSDRALFKGIAWFRKKIYINDSLAKLSFAVTLVQYGASELYIDGALLDKFGKIGKTEEETEYYNPYQEPLFFHFDDTGFHTIAIRYANFRLKDGKGRGSEQLGFSLRISEANKANTNFTVIRMVMFSVLLGLGCIFVTLAAVHFLLWLFRRADKSNLFLSILCMVVCIYFFTKCYWSQTSDADMDIHQQNTDNGLFVIALLALSALINDLFGSYKVRFWIISGICAITFWMILKDMDNKNIAYSIAVVVVMSEAAVLLVRAIRNKIKGAGILGFSILPLSLFSIFGVVADNFSTNTGSAESLSGTGALLLLVGFIKILAYACIPISMSVFLAWRFARVNKDLAVQLEHVQALSERTHKQELEKQRILETQKEELEREVTERTSEIVEEKKKSDDLLLNILPEEVARELKEKGKTTAHVYDKVSVMFTDFVDFTQAGERMGSEALVAELHACFKAFDEIMGKYGIEKIKTIGDAYLAVCGLPTADERHAEKVVQAAKDIRAFMMQRRQQLGDKTFEIRIGIHSGDVVAGIVGVKKFAYDIWGDTVNTAARMESNSEAGKINISQTTYEQVQDKFTCTYRGEIEAKGKGMLKMYFVD